MLITRTILVFRIESRWSVNAYETLEQCHYTKQYLYLLNGLFLFICIRDMEGDPVYESGNFSVQFYTFGSFEDLFISRLLSLR